MRKINKRGLEFNFAWIFAIIAGVAILFLAVYATSKFVSVRRYELDTQTAAQISILLDPLETSLESGKSTSIQFNTDTRIYNRCSSKGNFGEQEIGVATKSSGSWQKPGETIVRNKYIFSEDMVEGRKFEIFTKPFHMPFKVSDLIFLYGDYCFIDAPDSMKDEISDLNLKIEFADNTGECSENTEKVCFSRTGCDIDVYEDYVEKQGKKMHYKGSLIYAAIFSSPELYECNFRRLMLRLDKLCLLYQDKIDFLKMRGCNSLLDTGLIELRTISNEIDSSQSLDSLQTKADEMDILNKATACRIF